MQIRTWKSYLCGIAGQRHSRRVECRHKWEMGHTWQTVNEPQMMATQYVHGGDSMSATVVEVHA